MLVAVCIIFVIILFAFLIFLQLNLHECDKIRKIQKGAFLWKTLQLTAK